MSEEFFEISTTFSQANRVYQFGLFVFLTFFSVGLLVNFHLIARDPGSILAGVFLFFECRIFSTIYFNELMTNPEKKQPANRESA